MKASSPFTSLALKLVGVILIVSSLIDYIVLLIPPNLTDRQWQFTFTSQIVDRGIIPMVGLALLLLGYWVSDSGGDAQTEKRSLLDLRLWALLLSSLLGLLFFVLGPIHVLNANRIGDENLKQINQKATQAESLITNESQQVNSLLKDDAKLQELDKAIKSGQVQGEQLARLQALREQIQKFKQNPQALNQKVEEAQNQLRSGKQEAEKKVQTEAWKLGLRTGISSWLLAFGYIAIGWTGLRSLGGMQPSRRKAGAR